MRLGAIPQSVNESIALAAGLVPTPLIDTLVALLLAKTIMAATAVGIFQALEREPLTTDEIAKRCGSDPQGTTKLVWALFACKYLKQRGSRFTLAPVARRWLSRDSLHCLHLAQGVCKRRWVSIRLPTPPSSLRLLSSWGSGSDSCSQPQNRSD